MATTTASITLSSSDLTGDALSLSATATLTKGNSVTGLDQTSGVARKTFTSQDEVIVFDANEYNASGTAVTVTNPGFKVYLRNPSTVSSEYFTIKIADGSGITGSPAASVAGENMGRLYAGDWTLFPWDASADADITVAPSVATAMTLEYMIIYHV
jgi:hypothetical protein